MVGTYAFINLFPLFRPGRPGVDPRMPDWGGHPAPPIGGNDLDPLGRFGGGGMLMDPRAGRHRDIEPRWDPVGPMGPFAPARPNQGRKSFFLVQETNSAFFQLDPTTGKYKKNNSAHKTFCYRILNTLTSKKKHKISWKKNFN
jgi:hypothetical protein